MTDDTVIVNIQPEDTVEVNFTSSPITSINGYVGEVVLNKTDIGLDQVDNTSDLDKPISTATEHALSLKADLSAIGDNVLLRDAAGVLWKLEVDVFGQLYANLYG